MALLVNQEIEGVTLDWYHRATIGRRDKKLLQCDVVIKIYPSQAYCEAHPDNPRYALTRAMVPEDFTEYMINRPAEMGDILPERWLYDWMKEKIREVPGDSVTMGFPLNYEDAIDV